MSKAIKKYFVLTICLLFLLALFNCGNSQNDADIKTDNDTGSIEKYIIQFETNTDAKVHAKKQSKGTKVILPTDIEKKGYRKDHGLSTSCRATVSKRSRNRRRR